MAKHSEEENLQPGSRSVESIVAENSPPGSAPVPKMSTAVRERFEAIRRPLTVPQQVVRDS